MYLPFGLRKNLLLKRKSANKKNLLRSSKIATRIYKLAQWLQYWNFRNHAVKFKSKKDCYQEPIGSYCYLMIRTKLLLNNEFFRTPRIVFINVFLPTYLKIGFFLLDKF